MGNDVRVNGQLVSGPPEQHTVPLSSEEPALRHIVKRFEVVDSLPVSRGLHPLNDVGEVASDHPSDHPWCGVEDPSINVCTRLNTGRPLLSQNQRKFSTAIIPSFNKTSHTTSPTAVQQPLTIHQYDTGEVDYDGSNPTDDKDVDDLSSLFSDDEDLHEQEDTRKQECNSSITTADPFLTVSSVDNCSIPSSSRDIHHINETSDGRNASSVVTEATPYAMEVSLDSPTNRARRSTLSHVYFFTDEQSV